MKRSRLVKLIHCAINDCQNFISNQPFAVFSESDFERLLCRCISNKINEYSKKSKENNQGTFSVHTQISYYFQPSGRVKLKDRVDIILLDESIIEQGDKHKGFKYSGPSIALELKYLRKYDSVAVVRKDLNKWKDIKTESSLFVVVLIDSEDDNRYEKKRQRIERIVNDEFFDNKYGMNHLYYKCLKRKV